LGGSNNDTRHRAMLRDFVPPIVVVAAKKLLHRARRKQYPTYETALMDCPEHGYENEDIANVVLHKTKKYRDDILSGGPVHLSTPDAYSLWSILTSVDERERRRDGDVYLPRGWVNGRRRGLSRRSGDCAGHCRHGAQDLDDRPVLRQGSMTMKVRDLYTPDLAALCSIPQDTGQAAHEPGRVYHLEASLRIRKPV
jgi:hypothetical protein